MSLIIIEICNYVWHVMVIQPKVTIKNNVCIHLNYSYYATIKIKKTGNQTRENTKKVNIVKKYNYDLW